MLTIKALNENGERHQIVVDKNGDRRIVNPNQKKILGVIKSELSPVEFKSEEKAIDEQIKEMIQSTKEKKLLEWQLKTTPDKVSEFLRNKFSEGQFNIGIKDNYDNSINRKNSGITFEYHIYFDSDSALDSKRSDMKYVISPEIISHTGDSYFYHIPVFRSDDGLFYTDYDEKITADGKSASKEGGLLFALNELAEARKKKLFAVSNLSYGYLADNGLVRNGKISLEIPDLIVEKYLKKIIPDKSHESMDYIESMFKDKVDVAKTAEQIKADEEKIAQKKLDEQKKLEKEDREFLEEERKKKEQEEADRIEKIRKDEEEKQRVEQDKIDKENAKKNEMIIKQKELSDKMEKLVKKQTKKEAEITAANKTIVLWNKIISETDEEISKKREKIKKGEALIKTSANKRAKEELKILINGETSRIDNLEKDNKIHHKGLIDVKSKLDELEKENDELKNKIKEVGESLELLGQDLNPLLVKEVKEKEERMKQEEAEKQKEAEQNNDQQEEEDNADDSAEPTTTTTTTTTTEPVIENITKVDGIKYGGIKRVSNPFVWNPHHSFWKNIAKNFGKENIKFYISQSNVNTLESGYEKYTIPFVVDGKIHAILSRKKRDQAVMKQQFEKYIRENEISSASSVIKSPEYSVELHNFLISLGFPANFDGSSAETRKRSISTANQSYAAIVEKILQ